MAEIKDQVGRYGVWHSSRKATPDFAAGVERAGYGALWLGSAAEDLTGAEAALDATSTLVVATGIVNVWQTDALALARAYERVAGRFGDRFGADHVSVQMLGADPLADLLALAPAL